MNVFNLIRIKSYYRNGQFTGCEHVYFASNQAKALERFIKEYPEHSECIRIAETVQEDLDNPSDWLKAVSNCGCLHLW